MGPINCPKPGPTLARALADAEKAVIRSEPRSVSSKPKIINDAINNKKNEVTALFTLSGISLPLYIGINTASGKATFVSLLGIDKARQKAEILSEEAISELFPFGERANQLKQLVRFIIQRKY